MIDFLKEILQILITIFIPVITSILTMIVKKWVENYIERFSDEKVKELITDGTNIILNAVNYTQQTYVDSLKESELFDSEAQETAFKSAKEQALQLMNEDIVKAIENRYGDISLYIETVIESAIINNKK